MAITKARHVESVADSGATSIVVTRQRVVEPCRIHRKRWSRIVAVTAVCQGVMGPHEIYHRKWSRVVAVTAACQGVQTCRSEFGWSVWRGEMVSHPPEGSSESGSRRSPDKVFPQSKSEMRSDSRGSPNGVFPQTESEMRSGSRRSPG